MNTLYLDTNSWDLALDSSGNIAMAKNPYALAQDAASALRTFISECYYDTSIGIPYFAQILGEIPPLPMVKAQFIAAALSVPEVVSAKVFITGMVNRQLQGQVQLTDSTGTITAAGF
jgi:hypothetical protein